MLGFNEKRETVKEPFASSIRESLRRIQHGMMTEKEKECEKRLIQARKKYHIVWN